MRGKRAPELARGAILDLFETIANESRVDLIAAIGDVSASSLSDILNDFDLGKLHMEEYIKVKFNFWSKLPWVLASLADWDEARARSNARHILQLFDTSPQDRQLHHRITWHWLAPGSRLRDELVQFQDGVQLAMLPLLTRHIHEMYYIPIAERIQEAEHSHMKRGVMV